MKPDKYFRGAGLGEKREARGKLYLLILLVGFLMLGFVTSPCRAQAAGEASLPPGLSRLTPAEQWVLDKVGAGAVADLKERFGADEAPRQLRARFLEALLTDNLPGFKVHRSGIYLVNAIIPDSLNMAFAMVSPSGFSGGLPLSGSGGFLRQRV